MIIIGAMIVVFIRHQLKERRPVQAELETSAEKFRYELQRSADEVIARMNERIDRLESLVEEADQRSAQLEWQLARLRDEEDNKEYNKDASEKEPPPETDDGFSDILEETLNEEDISVATGPIQSVRALNAYRSASEPHAVIQPSEEETVAMAQEVINQEVMNEDLTGAVQPEETVPMMFENEETPDGGGDLRTAMLRQLIREGASDDEIVRRIHIGRAAIRLMRQVEENLGGKFAR